MEELIWVFITMLEMLLWKHESYLHCPTMMLAVAVTTLQFGLLCKIINFRRIIARTVVNGRGSLTHQPTIKFETFAVEKKSNANKHALKANKNFRKIQKGISFCFGDDVQEKKQPGKPHE